MDKEERDKGEWGRRRMSKSVVSFVQPKCPREKEGAKQPMDEGGGNQNGKKEGRE